MDKLLTEWNKKTNGDIRIAPNFVIIKTVLSTDDQDLISKTEHESQKANCVLL